jgi:hypothetical protein
MSEEFDFISRPESKNDEHVWCKIDQDGKLEVFDWEFVEKTAVEYDMAGAVTQRSNAQIICKLAMLIRQQALEQAAAALTKYRDLPATATVIMLKDPLGEELADAHSGLKRKGLLCCYGATSHFVWQRGSA